VVNLVLLACVFLRVLTKKGRQLLRGGKVHPIENPGYAYVLNSRILPVSDKSDSINERNHQEQNKITYFRGVPEVPMN